jgi:hypothetical protein
MLLKIRFALATMCEDHDTAHEDVLNRFSLADLSFVIFLTRLPPKTMAYSK